MIYASLIIDKSLHSIYQFPNVYFYGEKTIMAFKLDSCIHYFYYFKVIRNTLALQILCSRKSLLYVLLKVLLVRMLSVIKPHMENSTNGICIKRRLRFTKCVLASLKSIQLLPTLILLFFQGCTCQFVGHDVRRHSHNKTDYQRVCNQSCLF